MRAKVTESETRTIEVQVGEEGIGEASVTVHNAKSPVPKFNLRVPIWGGPDILNEDLALIEAKALHQALGIAIDIFDPRKLKMSS